MRRLVLIVAGLAVIPVGALVTGATLAACSSSSGGGGAAPQGACATGDAGFAPDGEVLTPCAWDHPRHPAR
jgi:hypothetical protein